MVQVPLAIMIVVPICGVLFTMLMFWWGKDIGYHRGREHEREIQERTEIEKQMNRKERGERRAEKMDYKDLWENATTEMKKHPVKFAFVVICVLFVWSFVSKHLLKGE